MTLTLSTILAYIATIVIVNIGFDALPIIQTPLGVLPVMAFFVGVVFILRDFVQRRVGHLKVIPLMLVGAVITWFTVSPALALASVAAFMISEFVDWAVYTRTKKTFEERVLISSALSTPVDSAVFLGMIGFLTPGSLIVMTASKMLVSVLLWVMWKKFSVEKKIAIKIGGK